MPRTRPLTVWSFYYFDRYSVDNNDDEEEYTTADPIIKDRLSISDAIASDRFGGHFRMQHLFIRVKTLNTEIR